MKNRPIFSLLLVASTISICAAVGSGAPGVKIIVNENVTASTLSSDEVKRIFLITKTSLSDGSHVEPVLARGGATYHAFLKEYIGKTDSALTIYYRSLVFTGKASMPKSLKSDAEVVAYVARNKGAIGFVGADAKTSGVKVLEVK
ncbi:MAG TPA: hypothetical protein VGL97_01880 [Bryobacteraceae bacterium]|jgi:ABC-type phosphate transport system substrate-binding protein